MEELSREEKESESDIEMTDLNRSASYLTSCFVLAKSAEARLRQRTREQTVVFIILLLPPHCIRASSQKY